MMKAIKCAHCGAAIGEDVSPWYSAGKPNCSKRCKSVEDEKLAAPCGMTLAELDERARHRDVGEDEQAA